MFAPLATADARFQQSALQTFKHTAYLVRPSVCFDYRVFFDGVGHRLLSVAPPHVFGRRKKSGVSLGLFSLFLAIAVIVWL